VDVVDLGRCDHLRGVQLVPAGLGGLPRWIGDAHLLFQGSHGLWVWEGRAIRLSTSTPEVPAPNRSYSGLHWQPAVPVGSTLGLPPIDWLNAEPRVLELAGPDSDGELYWTRVSFAGPEASMTTACSAVPQPGNFRAVALLGPGRLAAVTADNDMVWWRVVGGRFESFFAPTQRLPYPARAVAAFARPPAGEVVVLFDDGTAMRIPVAT
jgi:hypothetical protein